MNADRQRLERTMDHLKLDKEHMEAENKELSNEILQKTEEFQTRKEELFLQRGLLQVRSSHLKNQSYMNKILVSMVDLIQ